MQTLKQLQSGELAGSTSIKLACGLTEFPQELFTLKDTLELLDLSGNKLKTLPSNFGEFKKLKIAFFSDNIFTEYPEVLADCPELEMIGFKANCIDSISEKALSKNIRWLILTNNKIANLPKSIGNCWRLQKCALAGNLLTELPHEMQQCQNLELLRISANKIKELPQWLLTLPKLTWLAYSDNPCSFELENELKLNQFNFNEFEIQEKLGEGASGFIYKAVQIAIGIKNETKKQVAIKVFKGEVTSDGLPLSEMNACALAGSHPNLVKLLGAINHHPEKKEGLVLDLIPNTFFNLGLPPSYVTCTRDTFKPNTTFELNAILKIAKQVAAVMTQLHAKGIMHGDLYAHNIMIDDEATVLLGDFGAATLYDLNSENAVYHELLDVKSFGCLIEDLMTCCETDNNVLRKKLQEIISQCCSIDTKKDKQFKQLNMLLNEIVL